MSMHQKLDDLFPAPSLPPSRLSPQRLPGATLESLAALQDVLKDNHERYHIFFNDTRFHNHITHRALAIYALGGPAGIIRDYYTSCVQLLYNVHTVEPVSAYYNMYAMLFLPVTGGSGACGGDAGHSKWSASMWLRHPIDRTSFSLSSSLSRSFSILPTMATSCNVVGIIGNWQERSVCARAVRGRARQVEAMVRE
ncbi:hypothetical protein HD554DRAFT_2330243 [Boletus coccyginus]|nr:hypothetical protein HD554DRAFT_2330243 [Boletus coccyginus]